MTYDREENRIVTQDTRAWIAGLGDEGGSAWLGEAMKLFGQPDPAEIAKYQEFIDKVVWGGLQISEGPAAVRRPQEPVLLRAVAAAGGLLPQRSGTGGRGPVGTRRPPTTR